MKWMRCRGTSRWYQRSPPNRAWRLVEVGHADEQPLRRGAAMEGSDRRPPGSPRCSSTCQSETTSTEPARSSPPRIRRARPEPRLRRRPRPPRADGSIQTRRSPQRGGGHEPALAGARVEQRARAASRPSMARRWRSNAFSTGRASPCSRGVPADTPPSVQLRRAAGPLPAAIGGGVRPDRDRRAAAWQRAQSARAAKAGSEDGTDRPIDSWPCTPGRSEGGHAADRTLREPHGRARTSSPASRVPAAQIAVGCAGQRFP